MQPDLTGLVRDSLFAPALAADRLLSMRLTRATALQMAALVAALGALVVGLVSGGAASLTMGEETLVVTPFMYASALVLTLVMSAAAVHVAGRLLGGQGRFEEALVFMAWIEFVALAVRIVQILALLIVPFLAPILALAGVVLLLWCLVNFVRALHRFDGLGRAVMTLLLGFGGLAVVVTLVLSSLGGIANV